MQFCKIREKMNFKAQENNTKFLMSITYLNVPKLFVLTENSKKTKFKSYLSYTFWSIPFNFTKKTHTFRPGLYKKSYKHYIFICLTLLLAMERANLFIFDTMVGVNE